ncbi:hypothetical protein KU75_19405 [Pectobacterium odoriferum]|uniref:Uncharacterized protein n=1 Tax=Pectobacterium odoriferum TaxID=78398 RepID=A0ABR4VKS9_9GAMM|nr:hypothetical protein [Pectobacterium odoriferum]KGA39972.1 hypothetical protein KU75_19405 [Pectobacterium odoriferum]
MPQKITAAKEPNVEYKDKTLHYRVGKVIGEDIDLSLQEMIERALSRLNFVKDRYQIVSVDSHESEDGDVQLARQFVNNRALRWSILFSELVRYSDGTNKSIITVDEGAEYLSIAQIAPPLGEDGKRREFLDSIMHIAFLKNHVVLIQSPILRTRELEKHITWLLKTAGVLSSGSVILDANLPKAQKDKIIKNNTKRIKIGTPLVEEIEGLPVEKVRESLTTEVIKAKQIKVRPRGRGLDIIKALLNDRERELYGLTDDIFAGDAIDHSNLNVSIEVSYNYKAKKTSQNIINNISRALRHIHPEDVELTLDKIGKIKGDSLIINKKIKLKFINGIADPEELYIKIHEWLTEQIRLGEIDVETD